MEDGLGRNHGEASEKRKNVIHSHLDFEGNSNRICNILDVGLCRSISKVFKILFLCPGSNPQCPVLVFFLLSLFHHSTMTS